MKIAVDLDDCLLDTSHVILDKLERHFGIEFDWYKCNTYSIEDSFCLDHDVVGRVVTEVLEGDELKPLDGAVTVFNWLSSFTPIPIITKRRKYMYHHTVNHLLKLGFQNFIMYLDHPDDNPDYKGKTPILNSLGIDYYMEDNPEFIIDAYKNTDATILMFNKPWNESIAENDRIVVVNNWGEVREKIFHASACCI